MFLTATILALTLSPPAPEAAACFDSVVLGSVDRIDDITPLSGVGRGGTAELTIRVSRRERGEATPASIVATGQVESLPEPRTALRIFLMKDGPGHYRAVYWTAFSVPRPRLPPGLRAC